MASLKLFTLFVIFGLACGVTEGEEQLPDPCAIEDTECLNKAVEEFHQAMSAGVPEYDIKPIDPLAVESVIVPVNDEFKLTYKNLQVSGFKNQKISDFKFDKAAKSMAYNGRANLNIIGDVTADYLKLGKSLTGTYTSSADVLLDLKVGYELETDDVGVQHMSLGPATITCEASDVHYSLDDEMIQAIQNDADIKAQREKHEAEREALLQLITSKIVKAGHLTIEENFRIITKALPATAFFTNL